MLVEPVTLEGRFVRLEPLSLSHLAELSDVAFDEEIWRYTTSVIEKPEDLKEYVETAVRWQTEGTALPFATIDKRSGRAVGSTRFAAIDRVNRHMEIGWTWVAREFQRTYVNTEAKYLMLGHAFENLGCLRVEFKTDSLNEKSRRALARIGAKEEGTFRNHMIMPSGRMRHSVYFSIIDSEWPEVKSALEEKLSRS
ncbi:MAG TPA: GNAT family protein [Pyrinomonadaceae bacterium]|nr:GNAT family protein [Pyrinomonadaceae bacterium]